MSRPPITRSRPYTPASGQFAGETFTTERQYRNALARAKGYASWDARRAARGRRVRAVKDLDRLRPSERVAHQQVGTALTLMHNDPTLSMTEAAHRAHTTPAAMKRHGGDALLRSMRGRYTVAPRERHLRRLWFITPEGITVVNTRDHQQASLIAQHDAAVAWFLATGDDSRLARFRGRAVRAGGMVYPFVTDLDVLEDLGRRGQLSFESIYATAA